VTNCRTVTDEQSRRMRTAAWSSVDSVRDTVRGRFTADWGIDLPESIFRFWAFVLSLGPDERQAMEYMELGPLGITDLLKDPTARPRDGLDIRVHGRFCRDPPEFQTFMSGGTDGLHYGLWFDDGRSCAGVARYYINDGGGVGTPAGTPLEALREELEETWRAHFEDDDVVEDDADEDLDVARLEDCLRRLRETLMTFETGDRPEEGEEYSEAYVLDPVAERWDPGRVMTLDGGGALVSATTTVARSPQRNWDDQDWCTAWQEELTGVPEALEAHVADAVRRLAAGDPDHALVLGRDLHWISAGDAVRERYAHDLLVLAYQALGRHSLAGIVTAHHRHRSLRHGDERETTDDAFPS
jgi:hypothetical protein